MPTGESAGGVYITIDADAGPLLAKYAAVESASRNAGQRIGGALASPIVDEFGRAQAAVTDLSGALISELAPAAQKAAVASSEAAVAVKAMGTAAAGSVTQIQATSGTLRVLEGGTQGSIRAAERFLTILPGVGEALQAAFPIVGAIALAEILVRVAGKFGEVSEADKAFRDGLAKTDDEIKSVDHSIENLNARLQTLQFGAAAGKSVGLDIAKANERDAEQAVAAAQQKAEFLKSIADQNAGFAAQAARMGPAGSVAFSGVSAIAPSVDPKKTLQAAQLAAGEVVKAQQQQVESAKQVELAEAELDAQKKSDAKSASEAAIEASNKALAATRADYEAEGKSLDQVMEKRRAAATSSLLLAGVPNKTVFSPDDAEVLIKASEEMVKASEEFLKNMKSSAEEAARLQTDAVKVQGDQAIAETGKQKLQIEQQYETQAVHTAQQRIAYQEELNALDEQETSTRIASLEAAQQWQELYGQTDEAARTGVEVEREKDRQIQQQIQDQTKLNKLKTESNIADQLQVELAQQVESIAKSAGDALANGLLGKRGKKESIGQAIGQDIVNSLKSTGQHILGDVFTSAIKEALQASGVNQAAAKLGGVIFGTPANPATGAPATGGILGKLAGALHIPGVGVTPAGTPHSPAVTATAAQQAQAQQARSAAQIQQIVTATNQIQTTIAQIPGELQQILAAVTKGAACSCESASSGKVSAIAGIVGALAGVGTFLGGLGVFGGGGGGDASADEGGYLKQDLLVQAHKGEYILNPNQVSGKQELPDFMRPVPVSGSVGTGTASLSSTTSVNSASSAFSVGAIHLHGVRDMQDVARRLPNVLKAASSRFQPASS